MYIEIEIAFNKKISDNFLDLFLRHFNKQDECDEVLNSFLGDKEELNIHCNAGVKFEKYLCLLSFNDNNKHLKAYIERNNHQGNILYLKEIVSEFETKLSNFANEKLDAKIKSYSALISDNNLNSILNGYYKNTSASLKEIISNQKLRLFSIPIGLFIYTLINSSDVLKALKDTILPAIAVLAVHMVIISMTVKKEFIYE